MNWPDALAAMRAGHAVRRASLSCYRPISSPDDETVIIYAGTEPLMLAAAWTVDDRPVFVFRGAMSGVLHIPDDEDRAATDWVVDEDRQGERAR